MAVARTHRQSRTVDPFSPKGQGPGNHPASKFTMARQLDVFPFRHRASMHHNYLALDSAESRIERPKPFDDRSPITDPLTRLGAM